MMQNLLGFFLVFQILSSSCLFQFHLMAEKPATFETKHLHLADNDSRAADRGDNDTHTETSHIHESPVILASQESTGLEFLIMTLLIDPPKLLTTRYLKPPIPPPQS